MNETQLQEIEDSLRLKLPDYYRASVLSPPFRPIGRDWVYWLYDEPNRIINETQAPLEDGAYSRENWRNTFLVIGQNAGGDLYVLDTALPASPVYLLSHEDYSLVEEYPDWQAYLAEWTETASQLEQNEGQHQKQIRRTQTEAWVAIGVCFFSILLVLVMLIVGVLRRH